MVEGVDIDKIYLGPQSEEEIRCIRAAEMQETYGREVDKCLRERMGSGISQDDCMNKVVYKTGEQVRYKDDGEPRGR